MIDLTKEEAQHIASILDAVNVSAKASPQSLRLHADVKEKFHKYLPQEDDKL